MKSCEEAPLAHAFCEYLKSEKIDAHIDDDGDVAFKDENGYYFASFDEDEPYYFELVYPSFYEVTPANRQHVTEVATRLTGEIKSVKLFVVRGNLWAAVEQFVADIEQAKRIFKRIKKCLDHAVQKFRFVV